MDETTNQTQQTGQPLASAQDGHKAGHRLRALAKEHPIALMAGAAAVAALAGVELAAGAALGLGMAMLATEEGRRLRRKVVGGSQSLLHRRSGETPPSETAPSPTS